MKRVLYVIHTRVFGGPHNQLLRLARPLSSRGFECIALLPNEDQLEHGTSAAQILRDHGVNVVERPLARVRRTLSPKTQARFFASFPADINTIRSVIRSEQVDLVQLCGLSNPHGGFAAKREAVPLVWQFLSTYPPPLLRLALAPLYLALPDVVMTTGRRVGQAHPLLHRLGHRWVPFFPPVDPNEFQPNSSTRQLLREHLGVSGDEFLVVTCGNRGRQKAHERFVEMASELLASGVRAKFFVIGSPVASNAAYYEEQVLVPAAKLNEEYPGAMMFLNPREGLAGYMAAADLFVLPSRSEGVPTVLLEAMASALPVVATDVGSVSEFVVNSETGLLASPNVTGPELAGLVKRMIADPRQMEKMGRRGRTAVEECFSLTRCTDIHVDAYESAFNRRTGAARC